MYRILHIPSGNFLERYNNFKRDTNNEAKFTSRAKAGHAIEHYRVGKNTKNKTVYRNNTDYFYLLPIDYTVDTVANHLITFTNDFNKRNPVYLLTNKEKAKSPIEREKILQSRGAIIPSKEEFLIVEIL